MHPLQLTALNFVATILEAEKDKNSELVINEKIINDTIFKNIKVVPAFDGIDYDFLLDQLKEKFTLNGGIAEIIEENYVPWVKDALSNNVFSYRYWSRYAEYLKQIDPFLPVNSMHNITETILDHCGNPNTNEPFDKKGMVVGHVQSGKTSNYIGLINKATDAGYKLIIVLAGSLSSLRSQTQIRIDEGFIGKDSSKLMDGENVNIGVNNIIPLDPINSLTSVYNYQKQKEGDFDYSFASQANINIGTTPTVLVIKKNYSVLENLILWLNSQKSSGLKINVPTLIIDDEADHYSLNTKKNQQDSTTINRLIRTLVNLFNRKTYIGYTATPFANLFVNQDQNLYLNTQIRNITFEVGPDLFPKDFIINLKAPSNYIGAKKIFGLDQEEENNALPIFRSINYDLENNELIEYIENEDGESNAIVKAKGRNEELPNNLPSSLKKSVYTFILSSAIRRVRGHANKHHSMLVNVNLYTNWISRISLLIDDEIKRIVAYLNANDESIFNEFKELYIKDFTHTTLRFIENGFDSKIELNDWEFIKNELKNAANKIEVRASHSNPHEIEFDNKGELDYKNFPNGLSVIVVGGNKLSRGLTLEGLMVSYFIRTTKMYDTLLQMGRWFGYRPGYADLCRIFTTDELFSWFNHISNALEQLREDFTDLLNRNIRPADYSLKVLNHPGMLTVTALNKMLNAKTIDLSYSGKNIQTYRLYNNEEAISNNFVAYQNLFKEVKNSNIPEIKIHKDKIKSILFKDVSILSITNFLNNFKIGQPNIDIKNMIEYINKNETIIESWNVGFISNTDATIEIFNNDSNRENGEKPSTKVTPLFFELDEYQMQMIVRNQTEELNQKNYYKISRNQIDSIQDRKIDLNADDLKLKQSEIKIRRNQQSKGLILLYPLDPRGANFQVNHTPIIGYSIYFPLIDNESLSSYTIPNTVYNQETDDGDDQ